MEKANADTIIAVFADHAAAEAAVKKLTTAGFEIKNLSIVGKVYHTDEKVVGFYNAGDGARPNDRYCSRQDTPQHGQSLTP